jgi:hypothetical protein
MRFEIGAVRHERIDLTTSLPLPAPEASKHIKPSPVSKIAQ